MKRASSVEALLKRANADFVDLRAAYDASLHEKHVRDDLKVLIKNIFENLRSCLDYFAHDIFETHCAKSPQPDRLYFPIRPNQPDFTAALSRDFPGLYAASIQVCSILDEVQPYKDPWLGQFNKLNNRNKHQDLVEQTRTETRHVTVARQGGSVSWGPGVTFGSGVSVMGVPIDPRTQMPIPNNLAQTTVTTWVDFRFKEIDASVIPFIERSIRTITKLFHDLRPLA